MLEGSVMEYVKWIIMIVSVFFISIVVMGMFKINEVNSFQQEVNYQIERNGGLTEQAIAQLDTFVQDNYGSCVVKGIDSEVPDVVNNQGNLVPCKDPFFLAEFDSSTNTWVNNRGNRQSQFGTQVDYAIKRHVGNIRGVTLFEPTVIGTSVSRIRGTSN